MRSAGVQLQLAAACPLHDEQGGIVLELAVLVPQDRLHDVTKGLGCWEPIRGTAFDHVDEAVHAEEVAVLVSGFGDSVRVQDDPVPRLELFFGLRLWRP